MSLNDSSFTKSLYGPGQLDKVLDDLRKFGIEANEADLMRTSFDAPTPMPPYVKRVRKVYEPVDLTQLKPVPMPVDIDLSDPVPEYTFPAYPLFPTGVARFDDSELVGATTDGVDGVGEWLPHQKTVPVYELTVPGLDGMAVHTDFTTLVIETTRMDRNALSRYEKTTKMGEEVGELHEAVLYQHRIMTKFGKPKAGVGTVIEEGADVILQVLDILSECYPDLTPAQLTDALDHQLEKKFSKWVETKMDLPSPVY